MARRVAADSATARQGGATTYCGEVGMELELGHAFHATHALHHFHHSAALHLLHHALHLLELIEQPVDFLNLHAGAGRDTALARGLDEFGPRASAVA